MKKFINYFITILISVALMGAITLRGQDTECDLDEIFLEKDTLELKRSLILNWKKFDIIFKSQADSNLVNIYSNLYDYVVELREDDKFIGRKVTKNIKIHAIGNSPYVYKGGTKMNITNTGSLAIIVFRKYSITTPIMTIFRAKYDLSRGYYNVLVKLKCENKSKTFTFTLFVK